MTETPPLILLHSPLVGPLTWQPVAADLRARGLRVTVPAPVLGEGPDFHTDLAAQVAASLTSHGDGEEAVLAVHSGAGALVPAIAALTPIRLAVYVDALLPHPGRSWFDTVEPERAAALRGMAVDGLVPPWNTWFPAGALEALLPDPELRESFVEDLAPIPLAYFEEEAPNFPTPPGAYVQTSEAYDAEAAEAAALWWPVLRLRLGNHLAPLTHPEAVAGVLAEAAAGRAAGPR